jgi:Ohr subfamily peroxiredoxin
MAVEVTYRAEATAWGGRAGRAASDDGRLGVDLSVPAGLGGDGGPGTNPEQLFAAGWAACFQQALTLVAGPAGVDVSTSAVTVRVGIGADTSDGAFALQAEIAAEIPGADVATVRALLDRAHQVCPYSKATRGNIDVVLTPVAG